MNRSQKGPWQKSLEHFIVGLILIVSAVTWAPKTIASSFLVSAGVNQALSWAKPDHQDAGESTGFFSSPLQTIKDYSYSATRNTVEAVARVVVWLAVFIGFIGWGLIELRLMIGCWVDGTIAAAKRAVGFG